MQIYKNIDNKPVSGYISTNDLMELQKLKQELFPDYEELQSHLKTMSDIQKGLRPRHTKTIFEKPKLDEDEPQEDPWMADDPMKPMSYSNAIDLQTRLTYRDKSFGSPTKGGRGDGAYIEQFDNKYYDAIK